MKFAIFNFFLIISISLTSYSQTYYIVRHAEKASGDSASMTSTDPPLSKEGIARANDLKKRLKKVDLSEIYSTNTKRTRATAAPTSKAQKVDVQSYGPRPDPAFIVQLKQLKGNVLVVGHSNTVDDIVNGLCGKQLLNDLPDAAYDNLFIVTNTNGTFELKQEKFGKKVPVRESKKRE